MKNLKKIALALGGLSAVCAGFAVGTVASTQKAAEPTLATATTQTTRRIYGIDHTNNFGWAYCMQSMCAHVWITGDSDAKDYTMSEIILKYDAANSPSGYYGGLFYVDIPVSYKYLILYNSGWVNQSATVTIFDGTTLNNTEDVFWCEWTGDANGTHSIAANAGKAAMSANQLAVVLGSFKSCDSSYADGYNAYPLVNSAFYTPCTDSGKDSTTVVDPVGYNGVFNTTIGDKVSMMKANYDKERVSPSRIVEKGDDSSSVLILGCLATAAVLAAGAYFFVRKKKVD